MKSAEEILLSALYVTYEVNQYKYYVWKMYIPADVYDDVTEKLTTVLVISREIYVLLMLDVL